jgi:putative transposase
MPRRPRVFVEGGIYHVYNPFARGSELFSEPEEANAFLEILRKARDRDGLRIYAWTLMSNHHHMAVRAGPVSLSRTMGYVQARFGQGYNRRHSSSGPRWQSRYKAKLLESPEYFDRLIAYIHLNPVVAGLVDDPTNHAFCGHRELLGRARDPLTDVTGVLYLAVRIDRRLTGTEQDASVALHELSLVVAVLKRPWPRIHRCSSHRRRSLMNVQV